jgi:hypothetical protein
MGGNNGAIGGHRILNGRCFFPAPTTIRIPPIRTALRLGVVRAVGPINKGETPCDGN